MAKSELPGHVRRDLRAMAKIEIDQMDQDQLLVLGADVPAMASEILRLRERSRQRANHDSSDVRRGQEGTNEFPK